MDTSQNPPSFLSLLDLLVQLDTAPAGFAGSICLGVEHGAERSWWLADFARKTTARFIQGEWPPQADAVLLVKEKDALRLVRTGVVEPKRLRMTGDRRLMKRFLSRYLKRKNMLSVRLQGEV